MPATYRYKWMKYNAIRAWLRNLGICWTDAQLHWFLSRLQWRDTRSGENEWHVQVGTENADFAG